MREQSVFECELSDPDLIELIQTIIGQGAPDYIPVGATLNLRDPDLAEFLKSLGRQTRGHLYECVARYGIYMDLIGQGNHYYPNLQTLILIGLIEFAMLEGQYIPLRNFLEEKTKGKENMTRQELLTLLEEYSDQYGESKVLVKFFDSHLRAEEVAILAKAANTPGWERCDTIKKFVNNPAEFRHGFAHELRREALWPFPRKIEIDEHMTVATTVPAMSTDFLIPLIWTGILRKCGYGI